ncbi:hypothetical protein [Sulfurimonas sp.]
MFRALKYLFLANLYKKTKSNVVVLFVYIVVLLLTSYIMNDLISVSQSVTVYFMLFFKWVIVLTLLVLIGLRILKILNIVSKPFSNEKNNSKKQQILSKEKLYTKSDQIMQKYMKD